MPAGRPSKYDETMPRRAAKLAEWAATDVEIAEILGIDTATLYRWKAQYPEFCEALKEGKAPSDARVERSLFQRAVGYSFETVDIRAVAGEIIQTPIVEHVPPDTTAAIFWLKNRKRDEWRDKQDVEHSGSLEVVSKEQRDAAVAAALRADS